MSEHIISVRGYKFAVEAKSGAQLKRIMSMMKTRADGDLKEYAADYSKARGAGESIHETNKS